MLIYWGYRQGQKSRGVTEKSSGMAGSIREEDAKGKCKENRSHGMHTRR